MSSREEGDLWPEQDYRTGANAPTTPSLAPPTSSGRVPRVREGVNPVEIAEELGHSLATLLARLFSHVIRRYRGKPRETAEDTICEARLPKSAHWTKEATRDDKQEPPDLQAL